MNYITTLRPCPACEDTLGYPLCVECENSGFIVETNLLPPMVTLYEDDGTERHFIRPIESIDLSVKPDVAA